MFVYIKVLSLDGTKILDKFLLYCREIWIDIGTVKPELTTACLQRPPFWSPNLSLYNKKLLMNNDHLATTAINFGFLGWLLYTSLTVLRNESFFQQLLVLREFDFLIVRLFLALLLKVPKIDTWTAKLLFKHLLELFITFFWQ